MARYRSGSSINTYLKESKFPLPLQTTSSSISSESIEIGFSLEPILGLGLNAANTLFRRTGSEARGLSLAFSLPRLGGILGFLKDELRVRLLLDFKTFFFNQRRKYLKTDKLTFDVTIRFALAC